MATGDQNDLFQRLNSLIPASWFGNNPTPVKDALLNGGAFNLAWVYSLYQYVLRQSRIATATGVWLDRIAFDFFGPNLPRQSTPIITGGVRFETDDSYRARILKEILRPRATRAGILQALQDLTGLSASMIEGFNPNDTSAYGIDFYTSPNTFYGSLMVPYQIFVTAQRPLGQGIANIPGYGFGYYAAPTTAYVDISAMVGPVTDAMIYATVAKTIAAGIRGWTQIVTQLPTFLQYSLNFSQPQNSENLIPWFTG